MIILIHILRFVGQRTQHGPAFIFHNRQAPHECEASGRDLVLVVWKVYDARCCFCISHHCHRSDLVHLGAHCVVLRLCWLCNHPTRLPISLAVEKAHATDVTGYRIFHCSLCDASSCAKGGFPPGSWRYTQSTIQNIVPRMSAILWLPRQEVINTLQAVQIDLQMLL